MYLCSTELFEIELFICIKMNLVLNNLQRLICHKTQRINQPTSDLYFLMKHCQLSKILTRISLHRLIFIYFFFTRNAIDSSFPVNHRINLKECEKKDKYLDLARELKKLWNMKVTIVPIVIGAFGTITKGLLKGLEDLEVGGRVETIQMTALLRTTRILRRVLETWRDLLSLKLQWKTINWHWCEKL